MGFMRYKSRGSEGIDSQTFPVSIAVIIILLGVIQTIKGYRLHQQNKVTQEESSKVSYQRLLLTAALIFCCIFFTESLGFVISCAIYIFLQTLVLLPRKKNVIILYLRLSHLWFRRLSFSSLDLDSTFCYPPV